MKKYLLFIYNLESVNHFNSVINFLANIADTNLIKYKVSGTSIVLNFGTESNFNTLKDYINISLKPISNCHFLLPHNDDMSVILPENELEEFLSLDTLNGNDDIDSALEQQILDELTLGGLNSLQDFYYNKEFDSEYFHSFREDSDEEDEDEIYTNKSRNNNFRLDDILDKINEKGINSLTDCEKNYLNNLYK